MSDSLIELAGRLVTLRSTSEEDLAHLQAMWNDGEVMRWVGFPEGLGYDDARAQRWLAGIRRSPVAHHFSVYTNEDGATVRKNRGDGTAGEAPHGGEGPVFCGEAFCAVDAAHRRGGLDIKFVPRAQGRGRSRDALMTLIDWVFTALPEVDAVWTEPSPSNLAARTLYYSCGLRSTERPSDLEPYPSYWELTRSTWERARS